MEKRTLLSPQKRYTLTCYIIEAMEKSGLSEERLADLATDALVRLGGGPIPFGVTEDEMRLWRTHVVTRSEVHGLRDFHARPLATPTSRAVLLGVTIALGLDRATVNRMAGGI